MSRSVTSWRAWKVASGDAGGVRLPLQRGDWPNTLSRQLACGLLDRA
jgi:hypothetical protein